MKVGLLYVALMIGIVLVVFVEPARVVMGAVLGVLFFGGCAIAAGQGLQNQARSRRNSAGRTAAAPPAATAGPRPGR
jgi:hypothetical protein